MNYRTTVGFLIRALSRPGTERGQQHRIGVHDDVNLSVYKTETNCREKGGCSHRALAQLAVARDCKPLPGTI